MGIIENRPTIDLSQDYRLMTEQVLPEMGFKDPEALKVPALEQIQAAITPEMTHYLLERAQGGGNHRLLIVPRVGGRGGSGVADIIVRSDPTAYQDGYVWTEVWGAVKDKAAVHNSGRLKGMWDIAFLLGDVTDPFDPTKAINDMNEPGLAHTGKIVAEQRGDMRLEAEQARANKVIVVSAGVGHMAVDGVGLRVEDKHKPQRRRGVHRAVHYADVETAGSGVHVPDVYASGSRLRFSGSNVGDGWPGSGVRRLLRVPEILDIAPEKQNPLFLLS